MIRKLEINKIESTDSIKKPILLVFLTILVFFLSQIIAVVILVIFKQIFGNHEGSSQINNWITSSIYAQFFYVLIAETINLLFVFLYFKKFKIKFSSIGIRSVKLSDLFYALIIFPIYYGSYFLVVLFVTFFYKGLNVNQVQQIGFNHVSGILEITLSFIALVVLPPITEEILVRGVIYSSLKQKISPLLSVLLTSALFASAHLPEGGKSGLLWIGAIDTFVLSVFLIFLREKTNGLISSMILHALKNGVAFYYLFLLH